VAAAGRELEPQPLQAAAIERALRAWRSAKAKAEKVPAYVILNDADLLGVAERAPASLAELGRCHGVGPLRLERYGDELLAVIDGVGEATCAEPEDVAPV
jgi:superfamily II DNA helicase RecQ